MNKAKMRCPKCATLSPVFRNDEYRTLYRCPKCRSRFTALNRHYLEQEAAAESVRAPSYFVWAHQDKSEALTDALNTKYRQVGTYQRRGLKFILTDSDIRGKQFHMEQARKMGCRRFFVYPHAAPPSLIHAHFGVWEHTTAQFVVSNSHAEILRESGYNKPIVPIGWYLTPIKPFRLSPTIRRVLFAPIHPKNAPIDREVNAEAFNRLYALSSQGAFSLTVRYVGSLGESGLEKKPGVQYSHVGLGDSNHELQTADLVVGHQSVAWKAVALGTPCIMMKEDMPRHYKKSGGVWTEMSRTVWDKVSGMFRYPYDILESCDTMKMLEFAATKEASDWKRRMIGEAFNPDAFIEKVEAYL